MNLHPKVTAAAVIAAVLVVAQVVLAMLDALPDAAWAAPIAAGLTSLVALLGAYAQPGGTKGVAVDRNGS